MEIEERISSYFTSNNTMCRRIMQEQEFVKDRYGEEKWLQMSWSEKEAAFNNAAVPAIIWDSYANVNKTNDYPDSFPRHIVQCGEKIVVDYDNDCQTWPDEHSGPFSWKTKSQQDLTLLDLEADQLMKKPEKTRKPVPVTNSSKESFETKTCPWKRENGGIWDSPFLAAERGMDAVFTNKLVDLSSSAPTTSIIGQAVANQELKEKKKASVKEVKKRPMPPPPPPPTNATPKRVDYHTIPLPDTHPKKLGHRKSHRSSKAEMAEASPQKSLLKTESSNEKKRDSGRFGNASPTPDSSMSKSNLAFSTSDEKDFVTDSALKDVDDAANVERSYFVGEKAGSNCAESSSLTEPIEMAITGRDEYFVADEDEESTSFSSQNDESQSLLKTGSEFEKANLNAVTLRETTANKHDDDEEGATKRESNIPVTGFDFLDDW